MKKKGNGVILFVLILILVLTFTIIFLFYIRSIVNISFSPALPSDCSNESIRSLWDSIFQETSDDIRIFSDQTASNEITCIAFKNQNTVITSLEITLSNIQVNNKDYNNTRIEASQFNLTLDPSIQLSNIQALQDYMSLQSSWSNNFSLRNINSIAQANSTFISIYKLNTASWFYSNVDIPSYVFGINISDDVSNISMEYGVIATNISLNMFYSRIEKLNAIISCIQNWTAMNTSCRDNDSFVTWFRDINNCNNFKISQEKLNSIAIRAREEVLKNHTWFHRLSKVIRDIDELE